MWKFVRKCPNVTQVILLILDLAEERSHFFGTDGNEIPSITSVIPISHARLRYAIFVIEFFDDIDKNKLKVNVTRDIEGGNRGLERRFGAACAILVS